MDNFGNISMALALCASWLCTGTAAAGDAKAYPGSVCVKAVGSGGTIVYNNGRIGNGSSTEDLVVECPLVKDELSSGGLESARMWVMDRHGTAGIDCVLRTTEYQPEKDRIVISGFASTPNVSSGSANKHQVLEWNIDIHFLNPDGYHFFQCTIPPTYNGNKSWIASFWVEEYADAD